MDKRTSSKKRKLEKHRCERKECKKNLNKKQNGKTLIFQIVNIVNNYFPDLFDRIREIEDHRKVPKYELAELITACIMMFILKEGSRNAFNNDRQEGAFRKNYFRALKMNCPHMDTVDNIMRILQEEELELLKQSMVRCLIKKKTLHRFRLFGKWFLIAVDGSGVVSYSERHCEHCLTKTSKNGITTYFHNVLEARLVCENGFSISLATQWIENPVGDYEKQDCELKAFRRLAEKLKKLYPRLPICILGDGLYPNETFLSICREKGWEFIVTFKDGNLPTVWKEVEALKDQYDQKNQRSQTIQVGDKKIRRYYVWVNDIDYRGYAVSWIECVENIEDLKGNLLEKKRFVHLTDHKVSWLNAMEISISGRLRWKIENEGFNTQKNLGYNLCHKFSRVSWKAGKNYYQCLQIGHMINQLVEMSSNVRELLTGKVTFRHLWKCLIGFLIYGVIDEVEIGMLLQLKTQIRLE